MELEAVNHLKSKVYELSELTEDEWNDFSQHWKNYDIRKNDFIISPGHTERHFYFIHSGVLRAFILNHGEDISIGFSYHGDFSGAYDSFLEQKLTDWNIQALTDTEALRISFSDLMSMFDKYKSIERWGRVFNANILIGMSRRQLEVRNYSAEERFDRLLNQSPHIFQLVSQKHLSSYLGMTPETFSRMRRQKMEDA